MQLSIQRSMNFRDRIESFSLDNIARRLARLDAEVSERLVGWQHLPHYGVLSRRPDVTPCKARPVPSHVKLKSFLQAFQPRLRIAELFQLDSESIHKR
jgi:hypothetical protein